jgi:hypothetical protein
MSKKPHHLDGLSSILGTLKGEASAPPSPAPAELTSQRAAKADAVAPAFGKGRPATGKKSNEEYCQTTISIRKATRKRVKQTLLDAETGQDVSELVEELLVKWLKSQG